MAACLQQAYSCAVKRQCVRGQWPQLHAGVGTGNSRDFGGMKCRSGNFFFRPARTFGGEDEEPLASAQENLCPGLTGLDMDSSKIPVSDDAMDVIQNTISRMRGGFGSAGLKVGLVIGVADSV